MTGTVLLQNALWFTRIRWIAVTVLVQSLSMGGAPSQQNELLIDGAPDTTWDLRVSYNPPVDAVQEVRVHAFEADAAYGHTGGGTANVVMKGGTTFHFLLPLTWEAAP